VGAAVNQALANGWTPRMIAAQQGHFKVVQVLLQAGAV
jgi:ankyrin repeat protein